MRISILILLFCTGCASVSETDDLEFNISYGFNKNYDSLNGIFSREMCNRGEVFQTPLILTKEERQTIKYALERINFLSVPNKINQLPYKELGPDEITKIMVTSPCSNTDLEASYDGKTNKSSWNCYGEPGKSHMYLDSVQKVEFLIVSILQSKQEYQKIPISNCRYY